jgi:hypothetical protein
MGQWAGSDVVITDVFIAELVVADGSAAPGYLAGRL